MVIVLLGPPGAGKGTQAPILAARLGVPILASGDLLRAVARTDTDLGREVDATMRSGALVPDVTTVRIFLERLEKNPARYLPSPSSSDEVHQLPFHAPSGQCVCMTPCQVWPV